MIEETQNIEEGCSSTSKETTKKPPKRGIIYLSSIPPYMNVTQIREYFGEFGTVGRVYLQLADTKEGDKKSKRKIAKKFTEGWIEFERKSVAKKVVQFLNNTQVSTRKKSKHYDIIWSMKYLSNFKWTHLHERLAYEKAARRQKLRAEIQLAKKKTSFFTSNLGKNKKGNKSVNKELDDKIIDVKTMDVEENNESKSTNNEGRDEFLKSLYS